MNETRLEELRKQINELDSQIVQLLNKRAEIAVAMGKAKGTAPIYDPAREGVVLKQVNALNEGPLPKGSLEDIYASILTACREIQIK